MELNEQEAHCIARLLQGAIFADDALIGCQYCKFECGVKLPVLQTIRKRLTEETGVDLGSMARGALPDDNFPHSTFLKNSNSRIVQHYLHVVNGR